MNTKSIEFIEKNQIWQNETTHYWFSVNSEEYCISDENGDLRLLDRDGCPIEPCNDRENIKALLIPEYEKHVMD